MSTTLGPYTAGEVPVPVEIVFTDANGTPLDITGYTAKFVIAAPGVAAVTRDATVTDGAAGEVTYTWVAADFTLAEGVHKAAAWVGNGTQRFASEDFTFTVRPAVGDVVPAI